MAWDSDEGFGLLAFFDLRAGMFCGEAPLKSVKSITGKSAGPLSFSSATISDQSPVGAKNDATPPFIFIVSPSTMDSGLLLFLGVGR